MSKLYFTTKRTRERERERERERGTDTDDLFIQAIAPHEGVQVDDLLPHSTYYNYTCEYENHQTNDDVLDQVLTMTVCLNYDIEMLRNLKATQFKERERERAFS